MRAQIHNRIGDASLCFSFQPGNIEKQIDFAYRHGATHFSINRVPFLYDALMPDNSDPYPNWSQGSIGLFRVFPPAALKPHIPEEIVQTNLHYLDKVMALIRQAGLRCILEGKEPLWLPESVYREFPHWRGGQTELGRIAAKPYFTPAIDEPEVLELYTQAMQAWSERYPEFDSFFFWTNDCGSGLPWSAYAYPGINGPARHRLINPGKRIHDWFNALNKGLAAADCKATINIASFSFTPAELGAIRAALPDNAYFNSLNARGESAVSESASLAGGIDTPNCQVPGIMPPAPFVRSLLLLLAPGKSGEMKKISLDDDHLELASELLAAAVTNPANGSRAMQQSAIVTQLAKKKYAPDDPDAMFDVWYAIEQAQTAIAQIRQRGISAGIALSFNTARWLYRPLVPRPLALTPEETAHYQPFLFSCASAERNADLCFILGKPIFHGDGVVWMTRWTLTEAQAKIQTALGRLNAISTTDPATKKRLQILADRLKVWDCILKNAQFVIQYQHALNISSIPRFGANHMDFDDNIQFDQRALELRKIAREELDNTMTLIKLLENAPAPLLDCAPSKEEETVFRYGPDIVASLRKKMDIMLNHWHEYEQLFPTSKVDEFEPPQPEDQTTT